MCGYAAAYVHSFCMLSCVERHVDMSVKALVYNILTLLFFYQLAEFKKTWQNISRQVSSLEVTEVFPKNELGKRGNELT
jgi:hypothetical protein